MKPAVIYIRRSTTKQEDSFAIQRDALEAFAESNGYSITKEFRDEKTGTTTDRASFQECLSYLETNEDVMLLVFRLDRLGRGWETMGLVENVFHRIRAVGYGDRPIDKTLFGMLAVLAEAESRTISARVKASYSLRKKLNPSATFGASAKTLEKARAASMVTRTEQAIRFEATLIHFDLILKRFGYKTQQQKCDRLNELGIKTRTGKLWSQPGFNRTLKRALGRVTAENELDSCLEATRSLLG
jgi:DNA invertase Pin-like site-specific DNA recombinase